ncbi:PE-PGRS family protein PE_PGRS33-like [Mya arenaria]|uniref:PE-PGRS family protein PE_PGRS33-like n=1 Tax=Mya arenaria TaxID=6604 RepID=UPI0022E56AA3|nr:PE-PGRS family protein PE_PGRS33-like [Mya arenaria]
MRAFICVCVFVLTVALVNSQGASMFGQGMGSQSGSGGAESNLAQYMGRGGAGNSGMSLFGGGGSGGGGGMGGGLGQMALFGGVEMSNLMEFNMCQQIYRSPFFCMRYLH